MTTATLVRTETETLAPATPPALTTAEIMERNRMSVPRITCTACHVTTARSNDSADSLCDGCLDSVHPAGSLYSTHGVAWKVGG